MKNIHDISDELNQALRPFCSSIKIEVKNSTQFLLTLDLKIKPQASRNKLSYFATRGFILELVNPPVDGEANEGLISFLAKSFGVSQSQGELVKGHKSKQKSVRFNFSLRPEKNLDYFLKKIKEAVSFNDEK
jgi:uncharacterized protein (TIGR00251 family)